MPPDGGAMLQRRGLRQDGGGVLWDLPARALRSPDDSAVRRVFASADYEALPLREQVRFEVPGVLAVPQLRMSVCLPTSALRRERRRDGAYY